MPDTTVKFFNYSFTGSPQISGTAGTLIPVLDACLVSGYGSVTLANLVVADGIATGTVSSGHGFQIFGTVAGTVIEIAGATPSALNGQWRIASVPGSTTFTFACPGVSNQTATGTITAKRAGAGWTKMFTGTNKAVYKSASAGATGRLLRVDDSANTYATLIMYESMTSVDAGTNPSTTTYLVRSSVANSTARGWNLFADDMMFYLFVATDGTTNYGQMAFGDIVPFNAADAYHCLLIGMTSTGQPSYAVQYINSSSGGYLSRGYGQTGLAVAAYRRTHASSNNSVGNGGVPYPNPCGSGLIADSVLVYDVDLVALRGRLPGFLNPLHTYLTLSYSIVSGVAEAGDVVIFPFVSSWGCLVLTGPWR